MAAETSAKPLPRTSAWSSPGILLAAATAESVAFTSFLLSCSTTMRWSAMSDHLRFGLELLDESGDVGHLLARLLLRRFFVRLDHHFGREVDPEGLAVDLVDGLLLGLHDARQRRVARLVQ